MRGLPAGLAAAAAILAITACGPFTGSDEQKAEAPGASLRVLEANPRYFADAAGKAVYLTGSHVWWSLVGDHSWKVQPCENPVEDFDFSAYLDRLEGYGHNFVRLWTLEVPTWAECGTTVTVGPLPWLRTGPGEAVGGGPKFDLDQPDPAYFDRLRDRVEAAAKRGIYVSVMLFEGWGLQNHGDWRWASHPFNVANNVNGVNGDLNGDGTGTETHTLEVPPVTRIQEDYVRRVVDTVGSFDNVLYEIANESGSYSTDWQFHMIRFVKDLEARRDKSHPVGMTFQHARGNNETLLQSPADWISPGGEEFMTDPPAAGGDKVSLSDTDHHCGVCGDADFVWRSFLRGHNPIYMDPLDDDPAREAARLAMGQARSYAERFDLARSHPQPELSSTQYCLVVPEREYLVYQPGSGPFTVELGSTPRRYEVEWLETTSGRRIEGPSEEGSGNRTFTPPVDGPVVLYLRSE
jgi:uncharacterized protein DUF4038